MSAKLLEVQRRITFLQSFTLESHPRAPTVFFLEALWTDWAVHPTKPSINR